MAIIKLFLMFILYKSDVSGYQSVNKFLGCYTDSNTQRDLDGKFASLERSNIGDCTQFCQSTGYPYSALQMGTKCFCGNTFGTYGASVGCSFTECGPTGCGGNLANSVYYSLDTSKNGQRSLSLITGARNFVEARSFCVQQNGDLVSPASELVFSEILQLLSNFSSASSVWIGLRKRVLSGAYEWTDESLATPYFDSMADYANYWRASDQQKQACVSLVVSTAMWQSTDCSARLPFVCEHSPMRLTDASWDTGNNSNVTNVGDVSTTSSSKNQLALYIILPLFAFCYGGSCVFYCVYKILKNCSRRHLTAMIDKLKTKNERVVPDPERQTMVGSGQQKAGAVYKTSSHPTPPANEQVPPYQPNEPPFTMRGMNELLTVPTKMPFSSAAGGGGDLTKKKVDPVIGAESKTDGAVAKNGAPTSGKESYPDPVDGVEVRKPVECGGEVVENQSIKEILMKKMRPKPGHASAV